MSKRLFWITLPIVLFALTGSIALAAWRAQWGEGLAGASRDPLTWPFAQDSIWNTPIGSEAIYVAAEIAPAGAWGMTVDENILILRPDAPLTDVYINTAEWSQESRCEPTGSLLLQAPIPADFVVPHVLPDTPNHAAAILMPDGRTLMQNQPFHRCTAAAPATSQYRFRTVDLYGDGIEGAHGGSGMSSIGGTVRLGELVPGGAIHHALKVNLYAAQNLYYDPDDSDGKPGYRWPAVRADGYAGDASSPIRYGGRNPALQMGALLALHRDVDLANNELGLETEPAAILARALQDYGAYVVDDTAWDAYAIAVEWSPDGRVVDEFQQAWGFQIDPQIYIDPWSRDMERLFTQLYVVDNSGPDRIGGGGSPRVPLAPPLQDH